MTAPARRLARAALAVVLLGACSGQGSGPERAELTDAIVARRGSDRACVAAAVEDIDRSYLTAMLRLVRDEPVKVTLQRGELDALSTAYRCP